MEGISDIQTNLKLKKWRRQRFVTLKKRKISIVPPTESVGPNPKE